MSSGIAQKLKTQVSLSRTKNSSFFQSYEETLKSPNFRKKSDIGENRTLFRMPSRHDQKPVVKVEITEDSIQQARVNLTALNQIDRLNKLNILYKPRNSRNPEKPIKLVLPQVNSIGPPQSDKKFSLIENTFDEKSYNPNLQLFENPYGTVKLKSKKLNIDNLRNKRSFTYLRQSTTKESLNIPFKNSASIESKKDLPVISNENYFVNVNTTKKEDGFKMNPNIIKFFEINKAKSEKETLSIQPSINEITNFDNHNTQEDQIIFNNIENEYETGGIEILSEKLEEKKPETLNNSRQEIRESKVSQNNDDFLKNLFYDQEILKFRNEEKRKSISNNKIQIKFKLDNQLLSKIQRKLSFNPLDTLQYHSKIQEFIDGDLQNKHKEREVSSLFDNNGEERSLNLKDKFFILESRIELKKYSHLARIRTYIIDILKKKVNTSQLVLENIIKESDYQELYLEAKDKKIESEDLFNNYFFQKSSKSLSLLEQPIRNRLVETYFELFKELLMEMFYRENNFYEIDDDGNQIGKSVLENFLIHPTYKKIQINAKPNIKTVLLGLKNIRKMVKYFKFKNLMYVNNFMIKDSTDNQKKFDYNDDEDKFIETLITGKRRNTKYNLTTLSIFKKNLIGIIDKHISKQFTVEKPMSEFTKKIEKNKKESTTKLFTMKMMTRRPKKKMNHQSLLMPKYMRECSVFKNAKLFERVNPKVSPRNEFSSRAKRLTIKKISSRNLTKASCLATTSEIKANLLYNFKNPQEILVFLIKDREYHQFKEVIEKNKVKIDLIDKNNDTLLNIASRCNCTEIAEYLINSGADVNTQNKYLNTPLHYAILNRNFKLANMLIRKKANENLRNNAKLRPWQCLSLAEGDIEYTFFQKINE